jgi:hypothetical protein
MKSSLHSLIPFLPLFCNCQFRRLDSIQFLCSQAHIQAGWRLETQLTLLSWTLLPNQFAQTMHKTQPLYCWEGVFTAPLHSNGSYSIVACVFVAFITVKHFLVCWAPSYDGLVITSKSSCSHSMAYCVVHLISNSVTCQNAFSYHSLFVCTELSNFI